MSTAATPPAQPAAVAPAASAVAGRVTGTFDIRMAGEPPYDTADGLTLGRTRFDKQFHGPLQAASVVHMLSVRTAVETSAAYVALERITGTLDGRSGSFVVTHLGVMTAAGRSLQLAIVPDSGTGALKGLAGRMDIRIDNGQHHYELDYTLPG